MAEYTFELEAKDFEFDEIDPRRFDLPVNFALKRDGETISWAFDAITYGCRERAGGVMDYDVVKRGIREGKLEELYEVDFDMLDDDDIVEQLVKNMVTPGELDAVRIRELLDEFVDTLTDEYAEFAELFDGPDFWPPPKYTDFDEMLKEP